MRIKIEDLIVRLVDEKEKKSTELNEMDYLNQLNSHPGIHQTLYAAKTDDSPWGFQKYLEKASEKVFFCGQNLNWVLKKEAKMCESILFEKLKEGKTVRFMICNCEFEDCVDVWAYVTSTKYRGDLPDTTLQLQNWVSAAKGQGLNLYAKAIPFVPVSMTFLDCHNNIQSPRAQLIITPNPFRATSGERPKVFFHKDEDEAVIRYYYGTYDDNYGRGKDILDVDVTRACTRTLKEIL